MNSSKCYNLLATAALVLSAGWATAWTGGLLSGATGWAIRFGLLSTGVALAGGSIVLLLRHREAKCGEFQRYLEALCRLDFREVHSDTVSEVPSLPADNPWYDVASRLREGFLEQCRRLGELEHARTAADIRCHRATTQAERIKTILSGLAEPILAIDEYDELVLANGTAEELFQFEVRDGAAAALGQLVRCEKLVRLLTTACHRQTSATHTDEIEIADERGNSRWYQATATRLPAAAKAAGASEPGAGGAVVVLRDVGEQKMLQRRNAEFVSAVSHEMKTPLAGIKAYVELLADGDAEDAQTQEEFLNVINSQADRLQRLVDNLLNLARIEAGVVSVNKQTCSLNELLGEVLRIVQPSAEAKRIELSSDLSPMYLGVLVDRDMLLQAAINLLSNAIKYTPEQGRVTLRSRLEGGWARFEVQDTGVGLSEEDRQRVFEKFYRVKKDSSMATGTGLGLPLARHIVEDVHGGRLWVESTLGEGSTFTAAIPSTGQLA